MLLREIRYGIDIAFQTITIQPFGADIFTYNIGNVYVQYEALKSVALQVTKDSVEQRLVTYNVFGMAKKIQYQIMVDGANSSVVEADENGVLSFKEMTGCMVSAVVAE